MWEHIKISTFRPLITKNIVPLLVFLSFLILLSGCGGAVTEEIISCKESSGSSVSLSWDAPTTNTDGSPLTDLAGYRIYYGTTSGAYPNNIEIADPTTTTTEVTGLTGGGTTYYFVGTAYNTIGNESAYSNVVCAVVN